MKLHKIQGRPKMHLTAKIAENAEKKILNNLCVLSDLRGELFSSKALRAGRTSNNDDATLYLF